MTLLGSGSSAAAEGPPPDVVALVKQAETARGQGRLEHALALLRKAAEGYAHPALSNNIATVLRQLGRYAEAHQVYIKVKTDPSVPADVRRFVTERLEELAPKLTSGWLMLAPADVALHRLAIDGVRQRVWSGEIPVSAGVHWVEVRRAPRHTTLVRASTQAGLRTTLVVPVGRAKVGGRLHLAGVDGRAVIVALDDVALGTFAASGGTVTIDAPPGTYRLTLRADGLAPLTTRVVLAAGVDKTVQLEVPPAPAAEEPIPPWVLVGAGVIVASVGGGLAAMGFSERADLAAALDAAGKTPPFEGFSETEAIRRQDRADALVIGGLSGVGVGVAALLSGAIWRALHQPPNAPEPSLVEVPTAP